MDVLPQGILENAIKITNEPPTGMHANLHAALDNFDQVNAAVAIIGFVSKLHHPPHPPTPPVCVGHPGPVQPGTGVQDHPVLAVLLPCLCGREEEVRAARLEQKIPLQHRRPDDLGEHSVQLPGG